LPLYHLTTIRPQPNKSNRISNTQHGRLNLVESQYRGGRAVPSTHQSSKSHKTKADYFAGKSCCEWQGKGPGGYDLIWKERIRWAESKAEGERGKGKGSEGAGMERATGQRKREGQREGIGLNDQRHLFKPVLLSKYRLSYESLHL
jgi:hypothetical protein